MSLGLRIGERSVIVGEFEGFNPLEGAKVMILTEILVLGISEGAGTGHED